MIQTEEEAKMYVHWKDVHGIKIEEILELDRMIRTQRFKPIPITVERIEFTLRKMKEERDFSTQGLATFLYKGGCKSIWFRPKLFFGTERSYVESMNASSLLLAPVSSIV